MSLIQSLQDHAKVMQQAIDMLANLNESIKFLNASLMPVAVESVPVEMSIEEAEHPPAVVLEVIPEPIVNTFEPIVSTAEAVVTEQKAIEYADVAKAITTVFQEDRMKVVNALAKFGAAKGPQLKVEDYTAFLAELSA